MKKLICLLMCLSVALTMLLTLLSCADNNNAKDPQNDADITTTATKDDNDDLVLNPEAMKIEDGYTVTSEDSFKIKVTEDEKTALCTARVATLKNADGEHALYIDVLNEELKVKVFKIWRGRAVVELYRDDTLAIMTVNVTSDKRIVMSTNFFNVSDKQPMSDGMYKDVESIGFFGIGDINGTSLNGSLESSSAINRYEQNVINFFYTTSEKVGEVKALKPDTPCVLLADSFSDSGNDMTYADTKKVASIFENESFVTSKLTFDYVLSLFSITR